MRYPLSGLLRLCVTGTAAVVIMEGCLHSPIVVKKSTCMVSWDPVSDHREIQYRVTTWPNVGTAAPDKFVYPVPVGKTRTTCNDAGARTAGPWMVSVQACTGKDNCSEPAGPIAFTIVDR